MRTAQADVDADAAQALVNAAARASSCVAWRGPGTFGSALDDAIAALLAATREAEIEACAKGFDRLKMLRKMYTASQVAAAIRARKETP